MVETTFHTIPYYIAQKVRIIVETTFQTIPYYITLKVRIWLKLHFAIYHIILT